MIAVLAIIIAIVALIVSVLALKKARPVNRVINIVDGGGATLATIAADGTVTKVVS